jgi:hypothetical protein
MAGRQSRLMFALGFVLGAAATAAVAMVPRKKSSFARQVDRAAGCGGD